MVLCCIGAAVTVAVLAAVLPGIATAALVGLVAATASALAKVCLDAVIQRDLPDESRASAFGRSETVLQLSWVFGGALGVLLPHEDYWLGFTVVAAVVAVAGLQTGLLARGRSLLPFLSPRGPAAGGRPAADRRLSRCRRRLSTDPGRARCWPPAAADAGPAPGDRSAPAPRPWSGRAHPVLRPGVHRLPQRRRARRSSWRCRPGTALQVQVPDEISETPWQVVFSYRDAAGAQADGRSPVFAPGPAQRLRPAAAHPGRPAAHRPGAAVRPAAAGQPGDRRDRVPDPRQLGAYALRVR